MLRRLVNLVMAIGVAAFFCVFSAGTVTVATAEGLGFCGRPVSGDNEIVATDCLFILQAGVGAKSCELCVCDVDGNDDVSSSDALVCLRAAVGIGIDLACPPCDVVTTTTTQASVTTTTEPTPTTTTTTELLPTTTTSQLPPTTTTLPAPAGCGDGFLAPPEDCDDGNFVAGDGCSPSCILEDERGLCAGVPVSSSDVLATVLFASGFTRPVDIGAPRLDPRRLFVVEQGGLIKIIKDGSVLAEPFLDIADRTTIPPPPLGERGLLGIAFDPDYRQNRRFYVNYTNRSGPSGNTVVARYLRDPSNEDLALKNSEKILFTIQQPFSNHNGGQLSFGLDGYLYVGLGDGGGGGDKNGNAQNPDSLLGKMLRVDVTPDTAPFYAVPPDNPDPSAPGLFALVWASGLRNPWRFSFDESTGRLFIADVGQVTREEVDVVDAAGSGYNFGWNPFEGTFCFKTAPLNITCDPMPAEFTPPVLEYGHPEGCSITGGYVYRGCALPSISGAYFYADYCTNFIRSFRVGATSIIDQRDHTVELEPPGNPSIKRISTFGRDARGEIYIADLSGGEIFKIVAGN